MMTYDELSKNGSDTPSNQEQTQSSTGCSNRFQSERVQYLIQGILERSLKDKEYEPQFCSSLTKELSETILREVKSLDYPRCKLVCLVTTGQKRDQGIHMVSRFLWDPETDSYATSTYENAHLYVVATVFATFFD